MTILSESSAFRPRIVRYCPFCKPDGPAIVETELAFAIYDKRPVSKGHVIIASKRHARHYFDLPTEVQANMWHILNKVKQILDRQYQPDGYTIGINEGIAAGQSVPHPHIHVIPRFEGDVEDPTGGVKSILRKPGEPPLP
ncbi:MAG: HIT family protein [Bacteroidota bacterium]